MWSDLRADAALRELAALAAAPGEVTAVHAGALDVVKTVVPFDGACVGAVDPETLLLTSGITVGFEPSAAENDRFVEIELGGYEQHSFANLVDRDITVLADAGDVPVHRRRDQRFNELSKLIGFRHETRLAFVVDGACWAVGDLYRESAGHGFDRRELAFLERAAVRIAEATRAAVHAAAPATDLRAPGAAVLIVDVQGRAVGMTETARAWLDGLDPTTSGRLGFAVRATAALARRGLPSAYTRLRIGTGWTVVQASPLQLGDDDSTVAVTIEEAGADQITDLLIAAHGLTRRERDVCREVLAGCSTREIAERLFIAPHTVQDHLKSIFAKVGVRSRRELVATFG